MSSPSPASRSAACYDLRGELGARTLRVTGLVAGTRGFLEHLGITRRSRRTAIPWDDVVRIEGKRIVVRDQKN